MRNSVHGTPEQFEAALKHKIQELGGNIQDDVTSTVAIDDNKERYIHTLIGDIQSEFKSTVDSMKFDTTDDSLIIKAVLGNIVKEFTVPYSDLKFDWDDIDDDTDYIIDEIDEEFNSAESIQAATFKDYNGIMGEPGATWTTEDLKAYWKANYSSDPVLNEYESMQSWLDDTIAMLHPVTDKFGEVLGSTVLTLV